MEVEPPHLGSTPALPPVMITPPEMGGETETKKSAAREHDLAPTAVSGNNDDHVVGPPKCMLATYWRMLLTVMCTLAAAGMLKCSQSIAFCAAIMIFMIKLSQHQLRPIKTQVPQTAKSCPLPSKEGVGAKTRVGRVTWPDPSNSSALCVSHIAI